MLIPSNACLSRMKCVLVSTTSDNREIRALIESAGHEVIREFIQKRRKPDSRYYIGSGKVKEIRNYLQGKVEEEIDPGQEQTRSMGFSDEEQGSIDEGKSAECVVFNAVLKPSQHCTLERSLGTQVWDRIWLILEIFTERASSKEAMLQVELAKRRYEIPLLKEWVHRARKGEHPGYMAGGAYEVDQYLEFIRRRERLIKKKLVSIEKQRDVRRFSRRDREVYMVSLTGYTNSGKSSLLQALTGEQVTVEDRMFSTLSTTTRKILGTNKPVLLTDTVGFIHDLPPWIIDAFHSTLEEVFQADTILLILDASDTLTIMKEKLDTCNNILLPDASASSIIMVANKIDLLQEEDVVEKINQLGLPGTVFFVSAKSGAGLDKLVDEIILKHAFPVQMDIVLNRNDSENIHWFYENTIILRRTESAESLILGVACTERDSKEALFRSQNEF